MLAFVLVVFLLIGLFRWLGELIGVEAAFALVGGLFVGVGMFLWWKKNPEQAKEN
jgi:membrane associated rhomboid family serine protease